MHEVTKIYTQHDVSAQARSLTLEADRARQNRVSAAQAVAPAVPQGPVKALDHLSLTIADGQAVAVVGPSGCGKSTLLRAVAGLVDYEGDVYYDNENMNDVPVKDRYIGMVFQNYALYPHFYGHGNLSFFFKLHKAPDVETEERIRITSEIMGIGFEKLLRRKPGTLSGGQQQRVAIARAIVRRPKLFLLDEPLSNLDAKLRTRTRVEIKRLLRRFGITAIYVTHDQVEATSIGDKIAVMRAGRIVQVGTYQQLLADPENAFVAGFFGLPPMNLLPGVVENDGLCIGDIRVPLSNAVIAQVHTGQAVTLGFRPDAAVFPPDAGPPRALHFKGVVEVVEPDFGRQRQLVYLRTGDVTYGVFAPLDQRVNSGYTLEVALPADALYYFDTERETRLPAGTHK